jgi:hypothetical protein
VWLRLWLRLGLDSVRFQCSFRFRFSGKAKANARTKFSATV